MKIANFKFILVSLIAAILFGMFARLGGKTVDFFWPDPPIQVEYKVEAVG